MGHMDIVLSADKDVCDEAELEESGEATSRGPRRSRRLSGKKEETRNAATHGYNLKLRRGRRQRHDSVMEEVEDDEEMDDVEEKEVEEKNIESARKEPEHRRLNRMRMQQRIVEQSPEEKATFDDLDNHEKTLVETLLQKYGFGHWNLFQEDNHDK